MLRSARKELLEDLWPCQKNPVTSAEVAPAFAGGSAFHRKYWHDRGAVAFEAVLVIENLTETETYLAHFVCAGDALDFDNRDYVAVPPGKVEVRIARPGGERDQPMLVDEIG